MDTLTALPAVITQHDAELILGAAGDSRYKTMLSGFTGSLTDAIFKADVGNLERLRLGFPGLVAAKDAYSRTTNGHALLRDLADGVKTDPECKCVFSCADDPATACSLSGQFHVHPGTGSGVFGPCPAHPDAPGDT